MRGEDKRTFLRRLPLLETPPRAWGRHALYFKRRASFGNTPTCVGKTSASVKVSISTWKHPHVRGEDFNKLAGTVSDVETPPRAWGRPHQRISTRVCTGNTPTCVGKTSVHFGGDEEHGKHPHVRGEDNKRSTFLSDSIRNTPTCVGKTSFESDPI